MRSLMRFEHNFWIMWSNSFANRWKNTNWYWKLSFRLIMMRIRCNVVRDMKFCSLQNCQVFIFDMQALHVLQFWAVFIKHAFYVMRFPTDFQQFLTVDNFFGSDAIIECACQTLDKEDSYQLAKRNSLWQHLKQLQLNCQWSEISQFETPFCLICLKYTLDRLHIRWKWKFKNSRTSDKMNNKHNSRLFIMHQYYKEILNWYFGWNWIQYERINKHLQQQKLPLIVDASTKKEE